MINSTFNLIVKSSSHNYDWLNNLDNNNIDKIFEKYQGKTITISEDIPESMLEKFLDEKEFDKDVTKIICKDIDRGISDWKTFSLQVKSKYPNAKYIYITQNFGEDNFLDSDFDVIIISDLQTRFKHLKNKDIVYQKEESQNIIYQTCNYEYLYVFEKNNKIIIVHRPDKEIEFI